MTPPVTVADFKAQFVREFDYGARKDQVLDADITRALIDTGFVFNPTLWVDDTEQSIAYLYATAHFLALNLQNAGGLSLENTSQGVNSKGTGPIIAKSVGQVSLNFQFPEWVLNSPIMSGFLTTGFGQRYLQLLTPRCVGAGYVVDGNSANAGLGESTLPDQELLPTANFTVLRATAAIQYAFYVLSSTETSARILLQRQGTIKAFKVKCTTNTLNGAAVITVLKNGTAQNLTVTLAAGGTFAEDQTHYFQVANGDEISIKLDMSAASTGTITALRMTLVDQL